MQYATNEHFSILLKSVMNTMEKLKVPRVRQLVREASMGLFAVQIGESFQDICGEPWWGQVWIRKFM